MASGPARVLIYTMPTTGHINPLMPVMAGLVDRGADVWCTSTPAYEDRLVAAGVTPVPFPQGLPEMAEQPASGLPEICRLLALATERAYPWALQLIDEHQPDVVLVDSIVPWGRLAAKKRGVPAVTSCSTFIVHTGLDATLRSKLGLARELIAGSGHLARWAWVRARVKRRFGVDPGDPVTMLGGRADHTFAYVSRELQPGGEMFGDDVSFVGSAVRRTSADHPELASIPDGPLIYISLGTRLNDRPDFLRNCLQAFADHPGPVLLSIGHRTDPAALGTLPANAIVRASVPQLAVLARAELFVTHGGMNSACEALVYGVPTVIYPQTADQPRVAERLEQLGAGVVLHGRNPSPAKIRAAVDRALEPQVRARAAQIGAGLVEGGGPERAAELVLDMADARVLA
jgi:MGT family glycosyltransferase